MRVDVVWLVAETLDMRASTEAPARVVHIFAARP
jgi:hypothetical protein